MESNAKKYFGKDITKEKVREYFRPTIKFDESGKGYAPLIKTKLSKSRVKVWTPTKEAGSVEDIRSHSQMCVPLLERSHDFQSNGWGLTLECQHVSLADNALECPFEDTW